MIGELFPLKGLLLDRKNPEENPKIATLYYRFNLNGFVSPSTGRVLTELVYVELDDNSIPEGSFTFTLLEDSSHHCFGSLRALLRNISRIRVSYRKCKTQTTPTETRKLPKQCYWPNEVQIENINDAWHITKSAA